jgi:hypothetical protein
MADGEQTRLPSGPASVLDAITERHQQRLSNGELRVRGWAMEIVKLAPKGEASIYPWKKSTETIRQVVEHARNVLKTHQPVASPR